MGVERSKEAQQAWNRTLEERALIERAKEELKNETRGMSRGRREEFMEKRARDSMRSDSERLCCCT